MKEDIINKKFGQLLVLKFDSIDKYHNKLYLCQCDCGNTVITKGSSLVAARINSCGCLLAQYQYKQTLRDLNANEIFGKLKVIKFLKKNNKGAFFYECICECGKIIAVDKKHLLNGNSKSCGCVRFHSVKEEAVKSSAKRVYRGYVNSDVKKGFKSDLSFDDFLFITALPCYYCGVLPQNCHNSFKRTRKFKSRNEKSLFSEKNGDFIYNGIDRIDNNLGHIKGNIVPCCKDCNLIKRNTPYLDFMEHISRIYHFSCKKEAIKAYEFHQLMKALNKNKKDENGIDHEEDL